MNTEELFRECVLGVEFQGGLLMQDGLFQELAGLCDWPVPMSVLARLLRYAPALWRTSMSSG